MADSEEDYYADDWPIMLDGTSFSGRDLLALIASGNSPFARYFDVTLLIREIEGKLGVTILDVPFVSRGSNNYVRFELKPSFLTFFCFSFCGSLPPSLSSDSTRNLTMFS